MATRKTGRVSGRRMKPPRSGVTVRMYRTGLGDCFLLCFPASSEARAQGRGAFTILVDCGVFLNGSSWLGRSRVERMRDVVSDIAASVGGFLDVLVITHEHWDHVSGFHEEQARDIFEGQIRLGQLWLAWTEDPHDALGAGLHGALRSMRLSLYEARTRMDGLGASARDNVSFDLVNKALGFFGEPPLKPGAGLGLGPAREKSFKTEQAMQWLRDDYGPRAERPVRYLRPGEPAINLEGASEARVYVLGPPQDETLLARYNPGPSRATVFDKKDRLQSLAERAVNARVDRSRLRTIDPAAIAMAERLFMSPFVTALASPGEESERLDLSLPFESYLGLAESDVKEGGQLYQDYLNRDAWRRIEADWLMDAGRFALQLDSATNNTSLAFALEVGPPGAGKVLLFPGDAMVGNWESWFGEVKIRGKSYGRAMAWEAGGRQVNAEDLLRRTVLYKVGHHGSHNATLRDRGLLLMGSPDNSRPFVAMLPVNEYDAQAVAGYGEMPLTSLVKELLTRTGGRLMRNDEDLEFPSGKTLRFPSRDGVDGLQPLEVFPGKHKTDLYIEYTVEG